MKRGLFIVIDGIGGSGKTTQIELLKQILGMRAVFTREPGGTPFGEKIRDILKHSSGNESDPLTDFFLFWAARAEHMNETIIPALKQGATVVCDRFDSSTFAMQVRGEKNKKLEKLFWQCREHTLKGAEPDVYIFLDADPKEVHKRTRTRIKGEDRFDERDSAYQSRIRAGYKEFAKLMGNKAHVVSSQSNIMKIHEDIQKILRKYV